ncbi:MULTISPECIES: aspartate/glutamate racemase family protein [Thalassospira]|uniref:aspartate/glutamate racemase family protein n=1 Tax=Thalassospira TaxID=168934 RepID=UPI001E475582|nr:MULTISPECIES: aspartate/glutamate racemase family protein [Thalassospira]
MSSDRRERNRIPPIRALVEKYGKTRQLASVRAHDQGVLGAHSDVDGTIAAFREMSDKAVHEDGAEIIILGGAVTAGMKRELQPTSPVPILDGLDCAIRYAEKLHSSRA